jgi:ubiquinone/menaquinone biosynthesis C-methylase UbiE
MKRRSNDFAKLWQYSVGFYGVWIAHIGRQMKLFDYLATRSMSLDELIIASRLYPAAVRAWCSAAQSYRFITVRNGKLHLKKEMRWMLIDKESPTYLGGQFSYLALRSLEYNGFDQLFKFGKTRRSMSTLSAVEQATEWDHHAFISAVRRDKKLHRLLSEGCRVLDVGCGTGRMLAKIHAEYPRSSLVGLDPSARCVSIASQIAGGKAITLMKGSGESMRFANEFEMVLLCESLYAIEDKERALLNCWRALKDYGTIVIIEGLLPKSNICETSSCLITGMQLDFALQGHSFMKKKDIVLLLKKTFSKMQFKDLGGNVYLVMATKKR